MRGRSWRPFGATSVLVVLVACSEGAPFPTQARIAPDDSPRMQAATARNTAVTSRLGDDAAFQIKSDGLSAYTSSKALQSEIQGPTGDWVLDSYTPTNGTRMVYVDFSRPVAGSGPNGGAALAIPSGLYRFHMISKCHLTGNAFLTIAPGQTVQCPLHIGKIFVGGQEYGITMNGGVTSDGETWPETSYANVTCNSTSGACADWTLTPTGTAPDGSSANVAVLIKYVSSGTRGNTVVTPVKQGDFYMSFRIGLTNP